jgi:predicted RNA-binding protein with PIN domain
MGGKFDPPVAQGDFSSLSGSLPASELGDYADTLAAYTRGRGRLQIGLRGYEPCHNAEAVISAAGYDPEADLENTPHSVFCAHGAGFTVKWNEVKEHMHLESGLKQEKPPQIITRNLQMDDKELDAILLRQFGPIKTELYRPVRNAPASEKLVIRPQRQQYLIVDGYNIIFAWEELSALAKEDLDAARRQLCDSLSSYAGYKKCTLVLVFDGYKQKGSPGSKSVWNNIRIVYTKEGETADAYIEALAAEIGSNYAVRVATSDALVQLSTLRSGILRVSARELKEEIKAAEQEMKLHYSK